MDYSAQRQKMIQEIMAGGVRDEKVLSVMSMLERHLFLPEEIAHLGYYNTAVGVECEQSISQPLTVAMMTSALDLDSSSIVLEVGTGTGYQTAILSQLSAMVYTVERYEHLSKKASNRLREMSLSNNVIMAFGDGMSGWVYSEPQKFDRIIVTAAAGDDIPPKLISSLNDRGIMVIPVGEQGEVQNLLKLVKKSDKIDIEELAKVKFVPLLPGKCSESYD